MKQYFIDEAEEEEGSLDFEEVEFKEVFTSPQ